MVAPPDTVAGLVGKDWRAEAEGAGRFVAQLIEALDPGVPSLHVAEWDGYGFRSPPEAPASLLRVHSKSYALHELPTPQVLELLRSEDEEGWPRLVPNLVWAQQRWCIAADIDCMSTYVGSDVALPDLDALGVEWVAVEAADRVS